MDAREELYLFIKKNGPMAMNRIAAFEIKHMGGRMGMIEELIENGYVEENNGLYAVTAKSFE